MLNGFTMLKSSCLISVVLIYKQVGSFMEILCTCIHTLIELRIFIKYWLVMLWNERSPHIRFPDIQKVGWSDNAFEFTQKIEFWILIRHSILASCELEGVLSRQCLIAYGIEWEYYIWNLPSFGIWRNVE